MVILILYFIILFYYQSDYVKLEDNKKTSEILKMIEPNVKTILVAAQTVFDRIPESLKLAKNVCSEQRFTKEMFNSLQNVN